MTTRFAFGKVYRESGNDGWSYRLKSRNDDGTLTVAMDNGADVSATITRKVTVCARERSERFWPMGDARPVYAKQ